MKYSNKQSRYQTVSLSNGFSAVELLITLFIAAAFLISGFQLYAVVLKDGGEARMSARAANAATEYLQQYKSNVAVENPCESSNPLTDSPVTVTGLSNTTVSVSITCPYAVAAISAAECTGGNSVTYDGLYTVRKFTTVGNGTLNCSVVTNVEVLVIGGGGGGISGGGGGGGYIYNPDFKLTTQSVALTVGAGGNGGAANGGAGGTNGANSTFGSLTAFGGGHGGQNDTAYAATNGSSGGGGGATSTVQTNGGSGSSGQGYLGGTVTSSYFGAPYPSAGGGGAGGIGSNPTGASTSGNGGVGISSSISGSGVFYGGGGGGSTWSNGTHGIGGSGVGGNGAYPNGSAGVANSGGGGGGGAGGGGGSGGAGGSGIVIVRYLTPTAATNATSKITATLKYGSPQQSVTNSTYVGFSPIVTNGLVLNLDAANSASYPGTGTTWFDLSGNGNNGTLMNSPTYSATNGGVFSFNGTNNYVATNALNSAGLSGLSIEAWLKTSTSTSDIMVVQWSGSMLYINRFTSGKAFVGFDGSSGNNSASDVSISTVNDNQWHHIVGTNDGSTTSIYIDSKLEKTYSDALFSDTSAIYIGSNAGTYGFLPGTIGSTRIYKRNLSASEVTQNFNALRGRYGL